MDDDEVGLEVDGLTVFGQFHVGVVAVRQEGGAAVSEVAHVIVLAQHFLQADGVGFMVAVGQTGTVGHTVAHAGNFHFVAAAQRQAEQQAE